MDITKFCATNDPRSCMHKPMRHEGYLYATTCHIAVRIEDDPAIEAEPMPANLQNGVLQNMATDTTERAWHPVPQVNSATAQPCPYCDGTGRGKSCNASGLVAATNGDAAEECRDCCGSGVSWRVSIELDGVHIAARYIHLIGTEIPGAEIGISKDPAGIQLFRAPGVVGCVMPMRP